MRNRTINWVLLIIFIILIGLSAILVFLPPELAEIIPLLDKQNGSLVDIGMWLITILAGLFSIKQHKPVLRHEIYCRDRYFIDRIDEREILFAFLDAEVKVDGSLFFVKSGMCRGKTALLRRFADDVNWSSGRNALKKKHRKSKDYSAYYIAIPQSSEDILLEISQVLCGNKGLNTGQKVATFLKKASYRKKVLLLIDNICRMQSNLATEMAYSLLYNNPSLKIILAITEEIAVIKPHTLTPPLFGEMHINELAKAYNQTLSAKAEHEIVRISNGIPSYVRMIFQTNMLEHSITLSNIEDIQKVVEDQLSRIGKGNRIAGYLACLKLCCDENISKTDLLALAKASESQLIEIFDAALAREEMIDAQSYISMDGLVAQCCRKTIHCDEYFQNIDKFYRAKDFASDIALAALLMSPSSPQTISAKGILKKKYDERKFLLFANLGELEQDGRLNALQAHHDLYNMFRYYYLSSLLQLGEYTQAISALEKYEHSSSPLPTLKQCYHSSEFEMQYLIIDLHHLSNQFAIALGEIDTILSQPVSIKQEYRHRLLYLKAHCLKHLGSQMDEAECVLARLENQKLSQSLTIKVLYSRLAIHLFWGNVEIDVDTIAQRLKKLIKEGTIEWVHAIRHLAHYAWKQTGRAEEALKIINKGLETLEVTRWRIVYDFYFEKAEWMRIQNAEEKTSIHDTSAILRFYDKAIAFADKNQDINLACCARLGKILTLFPEEGSSDSWCDVQWEIANNEFTKMDKAQLTINKIYTTYLKTLLSKEVPSLAFIQYCKASHFYDLIQHIENGKALKLTVM